MPYNDADDDDLYFVLTSFNKGSLFNFHVNLPYGPFFFKLKTQTFFPETFAKVEVDFDAEEHA